MRQRSAPYCWLAKDSNVQERIRDYHDSLESALGSEGFGTSLDGYESFINDDE